MKSKVMNHWEDDIDDERRDYFVEGSKGQSRPVALELVNNAGKAHWIPYNQVRFFEWDEGIKIHTTFGVYQIVGVKIKTLWPILGSYSVRSIRAAKRSQRQIDLGQDGDGFCIHEILFPGMSIE